jgi:hypothetical protein
MNLRLPSITNAIANRRILGIVVAICAAAKPVLAQNQPAISIEHLITDGWEIAGYAASSGPYSFILFKHKDHHFLIQCSVLYDATRGQRAVERVVTNCYEVR